jgi:hypothetical protein
MYKIQRGVIPKRHLIELSFAQGIPWSDMKIGDCVVIPAADMQGHKTLSCRNILYDIALQNGMRVRTELTPECLKIWRKS